MTADSTLHIESSRAEEEQNLLIRLKAMDFDKSVLHCANRIAHVRTRAHTRTHTRFVYNLYVHVGGLALLSNMYRMSLAGKHLN